MCRVCALEYETFSPLDQGHFYSLVPMSSHLSTVFMVVHTEQKLVCEHLIF